MVGKIFSFCVEPYLLPFELELDRLEEIFPNAVARKVAKIANVIMDKNIVVGMSILAKRAFLGCVQESKQDACQSLRTWFEGRNMLQLGSFTVNRISVKV
jgi:hypothetical protein